MTPTPSVRRTLPCRRAGKRHDLWESCRQGNSTVRNRRRNSSEFGTLHTSQISGKDSSGVRTKVLSEFKSFEPSLITNSRCLTEGVDIPVIDAVINLGALTLLLLGL